MPITQDAILQQLRQVNDPELHRDLVSLNMIKNVAYCDGTASITVELTTPACPLKDKIRQDVQDAVMALGREMKQVNVQFTARPQIPPQQQAAQNNPLPQVKHIIAVGAGKGGVGKSTVSVNLAVALARQLKGGGGQVGLLDADIYGPSAPTLLGLAGVKPQLAEGNMFVPFECHGIKAMTIGALVDADKPLIWRGPMAHGAFRQLATQTLWGELDYLVIDLPPGTGDVPLTMAQVLPIAGAVMVCTPQKVAQDDARRAVAMFHQLQVPLLGVVENMSFFIGDDGKEYDLFGKGGARRMALELGLPFLGDIPINMALRANSDLGTPLANFAPGPLGDSLSALANNVAVQVRLQASEGPTITIQG